jgi:hypothetical protein
MLVPTGSPESIELGAWGTRLVPALRKYRHGPSLRQQGLKKLEHHRHQRSLMHPLGLRASGDLVYFSQLEDSGVCPPWGTRCWLEHSW